MFFFLWLCSYNIVSALEQLRCEDDDDAVYAFLSFYGCRIPLRCSLLPIAFYLGLSVREKCWCVVVLRTSVKFSIYIHSQFSIEESPNDVKFSILKENFCELSCSHTSFVQNIVFRSNCKGIYTIYIVSYVYNVLICYRKL